MDKKLIHSSKDEHKSAINFILLIASTITLYFNSKMADPFNAPKMYILIFFSIVIIPYLLLTKNNSRKLDKITIVISIFFIFSLFWAFVNSQSKLTAFFGETQRQLGILTYLGFLLFFLFFVKFISLKLIKSLQISAIFLSFIYIIYGLMQYSGNDFVKWVNQYNPIIGTLGNPNYAAAFMAILFVICFGSIFDLNSGIKLKLVYSMNCIGLLLVIFLSNARQGILSLIAGVASFITILVYFKNKKLGILAILVVLISSSYAIAGMLRFGPLSGYLYKESLSLRGYYWRAGIQMFEEKPFTGVGLDNYSAYFRASRDPQFPINHGYDLISSNAHNVPIQMFATGGCFLGLSYLLILAWTIYCGVKGLKLSTGNDRTRHAVLFSSWITFQSQSIVSIDNIGLTIWGWVISGYIIGSSSNLNSRKLDSSKNRIRYNPNKNIEPISRVSTIALAMLGIVLISVISKSETNLASMRAEYNSESQNRALEYAEKISNDNFALPIYKIQVADLLFSLGQREKAVVLVKQVVKDSPNNPTYQWALANILESDNQFLQAINVRKELIQSDPQNIYNYLQLTRLYIETKNSTLAEKSAMKIAELNSSSEQAKIAIQELTSYKARVENE